jgi:hypothetical protein
MRAATNLLFGPLFVMAFASACGGTRAPDASGGPAAPAAPAAKAGSTTTTAGQPGPVTEERFCGLVDRLAEKIDASIDAALKKKDLAPEEAASVLHRVTPEGAKADMAEIVAASGLDPLAVAAFVRDQQDAAKRCTDRLALHVEASMQRAAPLVERAKQAKAP